MSEQNPPPICGPHRVRERRRNTEERLTLIERELDELREAIQRIERHLKGAIDSFNHDINVSLDRMMAEQKRVERIVVGERGDNGLTAAVASLSRDLRKLREAVARSERFSIAVLLCLLGIFVTQAYRVFLP